MTEGQAALAALWNVLAVCECPDCGQAFAERIPEPGDVLERVVEVCEDCERSAGLPTITPRDGE